MFDYDGVNQCIGGIETYLLKLSEVCEEIGWQPMLFQCANKPFKRMINNLEVIGVPVVKLDQKLWKQELFKAVCKEVDINKDLVIFGADHYSVPSNSPRCISIQHGISWDLPTRYFTKKKYCKSGLGAQLKKKLLIRSSVKYFENCKNRVCVDYNFLNWYRTMISEEPKGRIWVIPNFTSVLASREQINRKKHNNEIIKILFARRFTQYRGVQIMAEATEIILRKYKNINVTFAGEGPEEEWLRQRFSGDRRVNFTKYYPNEVLDIHLSHDIAVIPSIASEGTSLSVAEAMGAGCIVVATAVGGITNMIIDGYNGILVMPNTTSLLTGIETVIKNHELRDLIRERAYEVAKSAFNLNVWKSKWKNVLQEVAGA